MVADVLEQVAEGLAWESIIEGISKEAIAEALHFFVFCCSDFHPARLWPRLWAC